MSVNVTEQISPRMWAGWQNIAYPIGTYLSQVTSTGDATGGTNTLTFLFKTQNAPSSGRLYNIEQIDAFVTSEVQRDLSLQIEDFDQFGLFILSTRRYRSLLLSDGDGSAVIDRGALPRMPLFMGKEGRLASSISRVLLRTANINTVVFQGVIQGYIWEPRSLLADGGLRRPADVVYGH